jgi:hypothetical protein
MDADYILKPSKRFFQDFGHGTWDVMSKKAP